MSCPRSSMITFSPFSVSSLAAQPPLIPEPITIASYVLSAIFCSYLILDITNFHTRFQGLQFVRLRRNEFLGDITLESRRMDRPHDGRIIQFLRLIDLMPSRYTARM